MPIRRAAGLDDHVLEPGHRVAYQFEDGYWIGGSVLGFDRDGITLRAIVLVGDPAEHRVERPPAKACLWLAERPTTLSTLQRSPLSYVGLGMADESRLLSFGQAHGLAEQMGRQLIEHLSTCPDCDVMNASFEALTEVEFQPTKVEGWCDEAQLIWDTQQRFVEDASAAQDETAGCPARLPGGSALCDRRTGHSGYHRLRSRRGQPEQLWEDPPLATGC